MESASDRRATDADVGALGEPRRMSPADIPRAAITFARAFGWHEPFYAWLMPEEATREGRIVAKVTEDLRDRFIPEGECWTIGAGAAITMWIPPLSGAGTEALAARRSDSDYAAYGEFGPALRAGDELINSLKPPQPHWFLDSIATHPDFLRKGLGGRLLDHDLAIRDAAGDACALDTHTPDNIAFYERRGFQVRGEGELAPGLNVYVMFRPPGG